MKFGIRVKIYNPHLKEYEWKWVHPSGSNKPYQYEDKYHAERMKEMCYPETTSDWVRVEEFKDEDHQSVG
jgi:hypothetical protein